MDDSPVMSRFQSHRNLNRNAGCLLDAQLAFPVDVVFQRNSLNQFHDNIIYAPVFSHVKHIDHIGMGQPGSCLGFRAEFCYKRLILAKFRLQHFHRNHTVQLLVHRFVDIRHATGTNPVYNFISLS